LNIWLLLVVVVVVDMEAVVQVALEQGLLLQSLLALLIR
jgi:hypothetical protein